MLKPKAKKVRALQPNAGVEALYRRKLLTLIKEMHDSVLYWVSASYKQNEPAIAQDALPANELKKVVVDLSKRWVRNFDDMSGKLADHFAKDVSARTDIALRRIMRDAGWTVKFKMTRAQRDIINATINQNVSLIKSIPQHYLTSVEGAVMRSVQVGGDLHSLSKELENTFGVTKRRAALIARDQNNKATSAMTKARQLEIGVTEAIWAHSHAGKEPRPTHLKNDGKKYNIAKGWYDPAVKKYIWPGELINCRCTSRAVIPGFN